MTRMKKLASVAVVAALLLLALVPVVSAAPASDYAVYSKGSMEFQGSGRIKGDAIIESGTLSGVNNPWTENGTIYKFPAVTLLNDYPVNQSLIQDYAGSPQTFALGTLKAAPGAEYFVNVDTAYQDGTKDLIIGWSGGELPSGTTLSADSYIRKLIVRNTLTLNIQAPAGQVRIIRVRELEILGTLSVVGGGHVVLYVDEDMKNGSGSYINASASGFGDQDALTIVFTAGIASEYIDNFFKLSANIYAGDTDIQLNNTTMKGNIYTGGNVKQTNSGIVYGLVYAPNSKTDLQNGCWIEGKLITAELKLSGSCYVKNGGTQGLPGDIASAILEGHDNEPDPTATAAPTATGQPQSTATAEPATTDEPQPTADPGTDPGTPAKTVTIKVTVARRMAIRLEDGTILYNGGSFTMPEGGTVKFQVCTAEWYSFQYTDGGQGIAGPKVYEYTHQKNKENYLRVDNDRFFKPVKFHFVKGDYQKLTGIQDVLDNPPLESLSINFPLGATVRAYAYINNQIVDTEDIFVDSSLDWYNWQY